MERTLGTQLRHLLELVDGAVQRRYAAMGLTYRPRFTPIMRCLMERAPLSVGEVARLAGVTQPAATQTVALMIENGLIETTASTDSRQKLLQLAAAGQLMAGELRRAWAATATAADSLNQDLSMPLGDLLEEAIRALEAKSFDERIHEACVPEPKSGEHM